MASLTIVRRHRGAVPADPSSQPARQRPARVAGRGVPGGGIRRGLIALATAVMALSALAPAAFAATTLTVTTPYPSVVVAAGSHVSFDITIKTSAAERVGLALTGAPDSWKAGIHGGGFVIDAIQTNGTDAATARIDLDVPSDATGTTNMVLTGSIPSTTVSLPLSVRVDAGATGDVTLKTDFPSLKGPSTQTFNFNLTLSNGTAEDLTFSVNAQGPTGWTIQASLTGQSQAASAVVKAGSSSGVTVSATAPQGIAAGDYNLDVVAVAGSQTIKGQLQVEITGTYTLTLATSDGRLNANGGAGTQTQTALIVTNTGTADVTNVKLTGTGPSGWDITFDQATIATIAAGKTATVNAQIKPSGSAIAGDYPITLSVAGDNASSTSIDVRYTVDTSLLWGIVGVALIVAVGAGIWWIFQRYGRR